MKPLQVLVLVAALEAATGFRMHRGGLPQQTTPIAVLGRARQASRQATWITCKEGKQGASEGEGGRGAISVRVQRNLAVDPKAARNAWLSYQWARGGGLPVVVLPRGGRQRVVAPLMMEETLLPPNGTDSVHVNYAVTGSGLLETEIKAGTHESCVRFEKQKNSSGKGSLMTWQVYFEAKERRWLWEAVTKVMISEAADNLQSHLQPPLLYSRRTRLPAATADVALDAWLAFVWDEGGGLPCPPPFKLGTNTQEPQRMIVPPFLKESIVAVDRELAEIRYKVDNPGLMTYQVHTHAGRVRFFNASTAGEVDMVWDVELRPLRGWRGFVQEFTDIIISTLSRNLKSHLAEPCVRVPMPGGLHVRKDSWWGGVIHASYSDDRPAFARAVSLLQPWSWGRSTDVSHEYASWSTGSFPDRVLWGVAEY